MSPFALQRRPAVRCGPGASDRLADLVTEMTARRSSVLLVVDPVVRALGLTGGMEADLAEAHEIAVFDELASDPKELSVDAALDIARGRKVDAVIGLGGGSAMDTAKVVAALAEEEGGCAPWRLSAKAYPWRRTLLICVPTTAGTGSEATGTSIISQADGVKNWFWGPALVPDVAVLDPRLTVGLPPFWTFWTGIDAFVHAAESRTNRYRYEANDPIAEHAVARVARNLERAVAVPDDLDARGQMLLAATEAGMAIANTGCAVAHNIGHALGSLVGVPHGRAVGIAFVRSLDWAMEARPEAFDAVAKAMGLDDRHAIASSLNALAEACGQSFALDAAERAGLAAESLADTMLAPANVDILHATARDASRTDVQHLARAARA